MPKQIALDEEACEILALAYEVTRLAAALVDHDATENRAHLALSMNGKNAAQIIAALIVGDEKEKQMLALLRARANSVKSRASALTARITGLPEHIDNIEPLFAELAS